MNIIKTITLVFLLGFTLLMINDYFPNMLTSLNIPSWIIISTMIIIVLISGFFLEEKENERHTLNWLIFSTCYILFLMLVLTILGGTSSTGISFSNPILWILLIITIIEIISKRKKLKTT